MATKKLLADEHGNELPELDPASDVAKIIYLLEYCRARGFVVGPNVQVGDTIVQVKDPRVLRDLDRGDPDAREADIWEQHGYVEKKT